MHKRIKRLFSLVVAFVLLLSSVFNASALTEGSNYSFKTVYTQVYYNWGNYQTADGKYHSASGQLALRTLDGEPIYCLQAHKSTTGDSVKALPLDRTPAWDTELSRSQKLGITWASIYGYRGNGINTYGYSAQNAQIATQMLIWEWQTTRRTSVSASASSYVTKAISGNTLKCYNKILEACRNHQNGVTWDKTSVTLNAVGESNARYFTDTSNRLSGFEISSNSNSSVVGASISGNKLKVWAKSATAATANIQLTKKMTNIGSAMCLTGAGQTMFYGAVSDPVKTNITVKVQATGSFQIKKIVNTTGGSTNTFNFIMQKWTGQKWEDYASPEITVKEKTGEQGSWMEGCTRVYNDITPALFRIKEDNVPSDMSINKEYYKASNDTGIWDGDWYKFEVIANTTVTVTAANTLKPGTMKLQKVTDVPASEDTTFEFKVEQKKGGVWTDYTTKQLTVGKGQKESNIIEINDCGVDHRYRIKETSCPDDWILSEFEGGLNGKQNGGWYEFDLRPGGEITVTANNRLQVGTLKLTKTITDNSNLMEKAETFAFKLYSGKTASGTPLREFSITVNTEGKIESAKWTDTNDSIEIDEENNAAVLFEKIKEGWYTVKEVLTDKQKEVGWVNASSQTVQVKANSESTVTFDNKLCASSIYVQKTADSMSGSEYKGAFKFAVLGVTVDKNGAYVQGTPIDNYTGSTAIGGLVGFPGTLTADAILNKVANGRSYRLYLVEFKTQDKYILPKECSYALGSNSGKLEMSGSADLVEVNNAIKAIQKSGFAQDKEYVVSECVTLNKLKDADNISAGNDLIFSVHNELQMGQIEIHKTGETFSSVTSADGIYTPVYAENALEGAKFAIFAAEDIIVNGRTVYEKGEQVGGNLVTDENGIAVSEELYLGKYTIKEIDAPDGYILTEEQTVELTAENTTQRVTTEIVEVYNERVKVKVILPKTMQVVDSNGVKHGENGEIKNVVFGLYANEDITAADGKFIPLGGLIETATVNVLGSSANFEFNADLPYGKYYIKEISTDSAYMLHDTTYGFEFSVTDIPADDLTETVEIQLDGIENRALGDIVGVKKDINGELVPGCEFQLYATTEICDAYGNRKYAAGDKVGGTVFSDKNGRFGWSSLYYGTYEIVEVSVPEGYVLPELAVVTDITINYRNTVQSVEVINDYTKVSFLKTDENGNPLAGAEFALYRREDYENDSEKAKPIATWVSTTEAKLFEKLAFGDYVVIETKAPQGYTLCGTPEYFTVENSGETIEISLPNRPVLKVLSGGKGFFPQTLVGVALVGLGAILFTYGFRTKKKKTSR